LVAENFAWISVMSLTLAAAARRPAAGRRTGSGLFLETSVSLSDMDTPSVTSE